MKLGIGALSGLRIYNKLSFNVHGLVRGGIEVDELCKLSKNRLIPRNVMFYKEKPELNLGSSQ